MAHDETDTLYTMSEADFEALEAVLTSDSVPEDCMDLEMLDGFLAAVLSSPVPVKVTGWLPHVWSAHGETMSFGRGSALQTAIRLVRSYYNEVAVTLGREGEAGWQPFCFAADEAAGGALSMKLGEAWLEGFTQGLECWPAGWEKSLQPAAVEFAQKQIEAILAPFTDDGAGAADEATRLGWLEIAGQQVVALFAYWRAEGLSGPELLSVQDVEQPERAPVGPNAPCPCESGRKYKKCCGQPD